MPIEINTADLERQLNREINLQLSQKMPNVIIKIRQRIEKLIGQSIRQSPEYDSLLSGTLREHFGLGDQVNIDFVLDTIIEIIQAEIKIEYIKEGLFGTLRIEILLPQIFDSLFDISGTSYVSPPSGSNIPWLQWLLLRGDSKVIVDYQINLAKRNRKSSRTGSAIMVRPTRTISQGWGVPSEFSGVEDNNWLTRSIEPIMPAIFDLIIQEIEKI